jgi:serine/threonine protein kinase
MVALPTELPQPGTVLGGKYRIERVLGQGVMGVVYEAVHERLGQHVAIKLPQLAILSVPVLAERFEREARASARLRHRNSVRVMDVDVTAGGLPYLVMELLDGHDLESEVTRRGPLPIGEAVGLIIQACAAMQEAHSRGIVHRDLKPSNMFLANEADGTVCLKVLDFGISKFQSEKVRLTATQIQLGTPLYMSPEQVRSVKDLDGRTDVWSLGVILYELLSGLPPFMGSVTGVGAAIVNDVPRSLRELRPQIPAELEAAVSMAMAKKPGERFASMHEMSLALAPFSTLPLPAETQRLSMASYREVTAAAISSIEASATSATLTATTVRPPGLVRSLGRRKVRVLALLATLALAAVVFTTMGPPAGPKIDDASYQAAAQATSLAAEPEVTPPAPAALTAAEASPTSSKVAEAAPVAERSRATAKPRASVTSSPLVRPPASRTPTTQALIKPPAPAKKGWDSDSPFPPP